MPPNDVARFHSDTDAATAIAAASTLLDAEREHAAKSAGHLPQGYVVAHVLFEAWIKHRRHCRMSDQARRERRRRLRLPANAKIERPHAAHQ